MRVLVVTSLYPPHSLGGYEKSCEDVVNRWLAAGHDVQVLCTTTRFAPEGTTTRFAPQGAEPSQPHVHRSLAWYWADHRVVRPPIRRRLAMERSNQRILRELLDRHRPEVISFWQMGGMSLGLITTCIDRRLPHVLVMGDDWFVYAPKIDAWTSAWVRRPRWLRNLVSRLIAVPTEVPRLPATVTVAFASEYLRQRARRDGLIDFTTSEIVPPGSDPADFPNRAPGERPWRGKLLAVGRVEPRKGFDNAVRALAELPTMTLRIVGPDSDGHAAELTRLAAEIGVADSLTIDGAVPREHLAATYADADVFVFPSRWDEPFGLVPLEAMSQATPVVATRRGGSAEFLVDGVNCLEVPNDDPAAIARAVRRLATDDRLRRQLVDGGLATSDAYRIDRYAASLERIHQEAAANIR